MPITFLNSPYLLQFVHLSVDVTTRVKTRSNCTYHLCTVRIDHPRSQNQLHLAHWVLRQHVKPLDWCWRPYPSPTTVFSYLKTPPSLGWIWTCTVKYNWIDHIMKQFNETVLLLMLFRTILHGLTPSQTSSELSNHLISVIFSQFRGVLLCISSHHHYQAVGKVPNFDPNHYTSNVFFVNEFVCVHQCLQ